MTTRNTILNELADLGSSLKDQNLQNTYAVPVGYFEGLADQIMNRIKALEVANAKDELSYLSPLLSNVSKKTPYAVPAAYFQYLSENVLQQISEHADHTTSEEEIESLSPLLSSLKNKNPYSLPAGYFENLETGIEKKETKVISVTKRRWYRLAVAAVFIGVIVIGGLIFFRAGQVDPKKNPLAWIEKNIDKKVSKEKIDEFVTLVDADNNQKTDDESHAIKHAEIKELMKDVSEKEIQNFLNDAVALSSNDETDDLMN